jgi:hypothetical protein
MDGTEPPNKQSAQSAQWDDEEDSSEVCTLIGLLYLNRFITTRTAYLEA